MTATPRRARRRIERRIVYPRSLDRALDTLVRRARLTDRGGVTVSRDEVIRAFLAAFTRSASEREQVRPAVRDFVDASTGILWVTDYVSGADGSRVVLRNLPPADECRAHVVAVFGDVIASRGAR